MKKDNKLDELIVMRYFIEKYKNLPKGKLVRHESPDFISKLNKKKNVNIELTEIILTKSKPSSLFTELSNHIHTAIKKKNEKLRLYTVSKPFQNWLIIYCESLPQKNNLVEQITEIHPSSGFDKTFVFDLFSGLVVDLSESEKSKR